MNEELNVDYIVTFEDKVEKDQFKTKHNAENLDSKLSFDEFFSLSGLALDASVKNSITELFEEVKKEDQFKAKINIRSMEALQKLFEDEVPTKIQPVRKFILSSCNFISEYQGINLKNIDNTNGGEGVNVGVIDSGLIEHSCILKNFEISDDNRPIGWDFTRSNGDDYLIDQCDHGSRVTSIIAHIAPKCKITPLCITKSNLFSENTLSFAISLCGLLNFDIINCSWELLNNGLADIRVRGGYLLTEAIKKVDSIFVIAAGNQKKEIIAKSDYRKLPNVITVGAVNENNNIWKLSLIHISEPTRPY